MRERREFKRVKKYFAVNIVSVDANGKHLEFDKIRTNPKFYDESGIDFSPAGLRIMCSKPLPCESQIQMKILMPDAEGLNFISAAGIIKWFKQVQGKYKKYFQIGVCFRNLPNTEKKKLTRLWKKYN